MAIGIAQLRLSQLEGPWTVEFWWFLILFLGLLYLSYQLFFILAEIKIPEKISQITIHKKIFFIILAVMSLASIITNIYIFHHFGTLPILSSVPDKLRFIINRDIFGLWEYTSLLPRIYIPLGIIYLFLPQIKTRKEKIFIIANSFIGLLILLAYTSRIHVVFVTLICYFSYLILNIRIIKLKQIIISSLIAVTVVLTSSVAIPAFRQYITYRDYYDNKQGDTFAYLSTIAKLNLPKYLSFLTPLYLVPTFNLQALSNATTYYNSSNFYHGKYSFSVFNPFLKIFHAAPAGIKVPWDKIFVPWWTTATFIFGYFADFGWMGVFFAALGWGFFLASSYIFATKRPGLISAILFAYMSFMVIMSIYTNYFMRQELYIDAALLLVVSLVLESNFLKKKE